MTTPQHQDAFETLWSDPLSRRSFLQRSGIGLGALLVGGPLAACTTSEQVSGGPTGDAAGSASLPLALSTSITALDPLTESSTGGLAINSVVYEALYRLDPVPPRTELTPELAADLPEEISPTQYRITLRPDVTFHDGTPLTADDVVYTIQQFINPETSPLYNGFLQVVTAAAATGPNEVELTLAHPTTLLAERLLLVRVLSKAAIESSPDALKLAPVGTGPYRVTSAASDEDLLLERFADYNGPRDVHYEELRVRIISDANARVASLTSRQCKVAFAVPESVYSTLENTDGITVEAVPTDSPVMINFHCGKAPFDDVRMRQAVLYAIDRDTITQTTFFGISEPAWKGYFRPDHPDYAEPSLTYEYDPDRARQLISEAGYTGDALAVGIRVSNTEPFVSMGPVIEANLREVGFVPELLPGDYGAHVGKLLEGDYQMMVVAADATALGGVDAEFQLRWQWYGFVPRNILYWSGPALEQVEALLDEALATPDPDARRQLLAEVQDIIQTEVPIGPVHHRNKITAWVSELEGFRASPTDGLLVPDGVEG
jgi:peptide/nickel transport system substrate-binding protein